MADLTEFSQRYVEAISQSLGLPVAITDRDTVIAVAGMPKKELHGKELHRDIERMNRNLSILQTLTLSVKARLYRQSYLREMQSGRLWL